MAEDSPIPDSNDDEPGDPALGLCARHNRHRCDHLFIMIHFSFGGPMGDGMQQP